MPFVILAILREYLVTCLVLSPYLESNGSISGWSRSCRSLQNLTQPCVSRWILWWRYILYPYTMGRLEVIFWSSLNPCDGSCQKLCKLWAKAKRLETRLADTPLISKARQSAKSCQPIWSKERRENNLLIECLRNKHMPLWKYTILVGQREIY